MKKLSRIILAFLFILCGAFVTKAQDAVSKIGQGKVVFSITYPGLNTEKNKVAALPSESAVYFKGNMSRVETGSSVMISDHKLGEGVLLMDASGKKLAIQKNRLDVEMARTSEPKPTIEITSETKSIAGHLCKKAIVTGNSASGEIWFTEDLMARNSFETDLQGIDGFFMEYQYIQDGITVKMTAKNVIPLSVDDNQFTVPAGFEKTTMQEYLKSTSSPK